MDTMPHGVCQEHLVWKSCNYRLAKSLRRVRHQNVLDSHKHWEKCVGKKQWEQQQRQNKNESSKRRRKDWPTMCKCVDKRHKPPFKGPWSDD